MNKEIVCKDGFSMSVQANEFAYCSPRMNDAIEYTSVEVGYPSQAESLLMEWIDGDDNHPTNAVYGYVPVSRISLVCAKHGGIVSGELPAGIVRLEVINESR
jgi:hypothetical protein